MVLVVVIDMAVVMQTRRGRSSVHGAREGIKKKKLTRESEWGE